jgi:peptide/nickel transport system permease protein
LGRMTFVLHRLLMLIPVAIGVTIIVFFMIHLIPGDPARTILGIHATPRTVAILHKEWGLDRPLVSQYWLFMDRLVHGNLGQSLYYGTPALPIITSRIPATLWLVIYAAILAIVISVPLAMIAASRKDGIRDHIVRAVPLVGLGMPPFWLALLLIYAFAITVHWFPTSGYGNGFFGHLHSVFLPALVVAIALAPVVIRALRASMLNVLGAEYITTAKSKGVPGPRLFARHVLRNAVIPAVTVLGINIGFLVGGTVIIEYIFAIPGIGQLMLNSIFERDFPVVQGVTLVFGVLVVLVNLLADLSYAALDPRVRFDR